MENRNTWDLKDPITDEVIDEITKTVKQRKNNNSNTMSCFIDGISEAILEIHNGNNTIARSIQRIPYELQQYSAKAVELADKVLKKLK